MSIQIQSNEPAKANEAKISSANAEKSASTEESKADVSAEAAQTDETLDASDASDDLETQSDSDEVDQTDDEKTAKKPFKNVQKRIDKLTKRAADERREKEYWKEQALKTQAQKQESKAEDVQEQVQAKSSDDTPQPEDFDSHADYVRAIAKWEFRQERELEKASERENSLKKEIHEKRLNFANQAKEIAAAEADYDEVMDGIDGVMIPPSVQSILLESESGARLAYELAKDSKEFKRICELPPLAAARAIGRVEARLEKESDKTETKTKELKTTKAPKPISPIGAKNTGSVKKTIHDPNLSQSEYEQLRREQMAQRG